MASESTLAALPIRKAVVAGHTAMPETPSAEMQLAPRVLVHAEPMSEMQDEVLLNAGSIDRPRQLLADLPGLPEPKYQKMRQQALLGSCVVVTCIATCVSGTHVGVQLMADSVPAAVARVCLALVYIEAILALACLGGLMFGDPGEIKRTEQTCWPVPSEVAEKLHVQEMLTSLGENITVTVVRNQHPVVLTYCVRCLVWRDEEQRPTSTSLSDCHIKGCPQGRGFHHCSICQRCVVHFDHHCAFFGRCIAGRGCGGNMGYFKAIIAAGNLGAATCGGSILVGLSQTWWGYWIAIVVSTYFCMVWCCSLGWFIFHCARQYASALQDGSSALPIEEAADGNVVIGIPREV